MTTPPNAIHLNFDDAWDGEKLPIPTLDFRDWGPKLRYYASPVVLEQFERALPRPLPPVVLYGSGDFHHLSAVWLRRAISTLDSGDQITLVSFDNHPDWDVRPPKFSCGAWINRALEMPAVRKACIWGCGNFEMNYPDFFFANRAALSDQKLVVHPWSERQSDAVRIRIDCMTRDSWRYRFEQFAASQSRANVYVTVDMDCLTRGEAATNWENGLFTAADIAWAIGELRSKAKIIGADVCGAYSEPRCEGWFRKLTTWWDHPKNARPEPGEARRINAAALNVIWPALTA